MINLTNNQHNLEGIMAGFNGEEEQQSYGFGSLNSVAFGASGSRPHSARGKAVRGGCCGGAEVAEKRQRRKIKNRESAARSRARKLAYNIQQQLEIKELKKENELLRKAIKVLSTNVAPKEIVDEKPSLKRSFSGPL